MGIKLLITGPPRSGKTTLVKSLSQGLENASGFYTEEMREGGVREGFRLVSIPGGRHEVLSHVDLRSPHRVGKYRVDTPGFERFLEGLGLEGASLVVIDEIGKMECFSPRFRELIRELLGSDKDVIATIAKKGTPFIEELKRMPGIRLMELTGENREELRGRVLDLLGGA